MQSSRLSAAQSVERPQRLFGLCDCLKQPRRVRPIFYRSKEFDMVEIRPRRRLHVIHLLPNKKSGTKKPTAECTPSPKRKPTFDGVFNNRTDRSSSWTDESHTNGTNKGPYVLAVVRAEINTPTSPSNKQQEEPPVDFDIEDDDDDESLDCAVDFIDSLPIYGFESPFHPKNYFGPEESFAAKLNLYAEQLANSVLEDAFLKLIAHWEIPDTLERWRLQQECNEIVKDRTSSDKVNGFVLQCEFDHPRSTRMSEFECHELKCHSNLDSDRFPSWTCGTAAATAAAPTSGYGDSWEQGLDNPNFYLSNSSLNRLSFRFARRSNRRSFGGRRTNNNSTHRTVDDIVDDSLSKFTYSPTGDDAASQLGSSSFQSSTWGSSTASSMRYVRRFTSKKFKTKPLLIFLHGIGDSADIWKNQLFFFRERGYETLAVDLIGHGLSCAPNDPKAYTFHTILTDLLVIFDRYSRERNVVIGHAYGSCFAAALARHRSKQVSHLMMLSGGGPFPLCPQPPKLHIFSGLVDCFWSLVSCGTRRENFYVPSRKQTRQIHCLDIPSYVIKYMMKGQVWLEGDASFHKQITIPTLLVYGLRDPFVTLVEECEMEKTIPRAFLELVPEASHMVMLDAPDQVNDMIYKFLRRWDR